jgi:hypothetical protein
VSTHTGNGSAVLPAEPPYVPEATLPPLPDTIDTEAAMATDDDSGGLAVELEDRPILTPHPRPFPHPGRPKSLRAGCYLMRYTPIQRAGALQPLHYDGTLRVDRLSRTNVTASGDLYVHQPLKIWPGHLPSRPAGLIRPSEPNPALGIPIFARKNYRYYMRVTQILEGSTFANKFTLGFELHRFNHTTKAWTVEGPYTAKMVWSAAPPGYPSSGNYLHGEVKTAAGPAAGRLTIGWISKYLRKATLEIDRVNASEATLDNGAGIDWRDIYDAIGWDVMIDVSDADVTEPSGEFWSDAEMHATMLARRDAADLDREWRYHLICVRRLDSTERGIMYDAYGGDSNNIPREGAGISSHWTIPNTATWGKVRGMRFGTAPAPYFRTGVHEIGHAMGLYHNAVDNGFMHTTPDIAAGAVPPVQFPDNVLWAFSPDDRKRLRHLPDIWVRPGGISFGAAYGTAPISPTDSVEEAEGLTLTVTPLLEAVPIGAPVRADFTITNETEQALPIPASLSMKAGAVRGRVVDPSGAVRTFWPLVRCIEKDEIRELEPGGSVTDSVTILRGAEGALFPAPGAYRVFVDLEWALGEATIRLSGDAPVMVTPPVDESHAAAALRILTTPDALLTLALGGDHLEEGIEAIRTALDDDVLAPHYEYIEAKRVGKRFGEREADVDAAAELLSEDTVMSARESRKAVELLESDEDVAGRDRNQDLIGVLTDRTTGVEKKKGTRKRAKAKAR